MSKPFKAQDKYFRKAKTQGKRARSYFKIEEVDKKLQLLRPGHHILDLGAAPGSFLQYAMEKIGGTGFAVGIDLSPIQSLGGKEQILTYEGDIYEESTKEWLKNAHPKLFHGVISDLAPKTTGIKDVDHWNSVELSREVLRYARSFVRPGGYCVIKIFHGSEFDGFVRSMKKTFRIVKIEKPDASRDRSKEVYLVGIGREDPKPVVKIV